MAVAAPTPSVPPSPRPSCVRRRNPHLSAPRPADPRLSRPPRLPSPLPHDTAPSRLWLQPVKLWQQSILKAARIRPGPFWGHWPFWTVACIRPSAPFYFGVSVALLEGPNLLLCPVLFRCVSGPFGGPVFAP
eukprot:scaffold905_cov119-Isochrysis_galbana.AAC.1